MTYFVLWMLFLVIIIGVLTKKFIKADTELYLNEDLPYKHSLYKRKRSKKKRSLVCPRKI